jgi:hypothetical protein
MPRITFLAAECVPMSFRVGAIISSQGFGSLPLVLLTAALLIGLTIASRTWREIHEEEEPVTNRLEGSCSET